jgi:hypothetical protein
MDLSPLTQLIPDFGGAETLQGFDLNTAQSGQRVRGSARQFIKFYPLKVVVPTAVEFKQHPVTGSTTVTKREPKEVVLEMVEIITPGDKNNYDGIAEDYHKRMWPREYMAFKAGKGAPIGKSLEDCEYVPANIITDLKYLGCQTEEQLADASDELCRLVANGQELRGMAQAMQKVGFDNRSLGQVNVLKSQLEEEKRAREKMQAQLDSLMAGKSEETKKGK